MRESKIQYNPSLSVKENATKNGVTEAAIRYYIKINHLDRRYDKKINIIEDCRKFLKKHPNATRTELQKKTGHSLSTIRQYWDYISTEKELIDFDSQKAQKRLLRQGNNYYATHPSVTEDLLSVEMFNDKILEPFCGGGSMADVIKSYGYEVEAYDIIDRGYGKQGDFFQVDFAEGEYDIISNPPYDESLIRIIKRCLAICNDKVAMLLPLIYLSGKARYEEVFKKNPPVRVYIYSERINIAKNGDFEQYSDSGANKTIYAWFVWKKGYKGTTELRWLHNDKASMRLNTIKQDLLVKIARLTEKERDNTIYLERYKPHIKYPQKRDLFNTEYEQYDASKYLCYAFRRKQDLHKDIPMPFGNMNGGFPFKIHNISFFTSESAYICGLFSDNSEEHHNIQRQLIAETNGYMAKKNIRGKNISLGRRDWNEFNVDWMLYVIWCKVQSNKEFRELLLSVPENAIIIENSTFQQVKSPDTSAFWGCRNSVLKEYYSLNKRYSSLMKRPLDMDAIMNDFCNIGTYIGNNTMGKILMIVKRCLHDGTQPDIDYGLLNRKNIHLLGQRLTF